MRCLKGYEYRGLSAFDMRECIHVCVRVYLCVCIIVRGQVGGGVL